VYGELVYTRTSRWRIWGRPGHKIESRVTSIVHVKI